MMLKRMKLFAVACLAVFSLSACSLIFGGGSYEPTLVQGETAPDVTIVNEAGEKVKLSDYAGKKVYLNVWASRCGPCKKELPELEKVYQSLKDKDDVVFLSLASPNDSQFANKKPADEEQATIVKTARDAGTTYPLVFDTEDNVLNTYGVRAFPTHIVINSDGTVASTFAGQVTEETLTKLIETAH